MSENGEIYTAVKKITLPPALTALPQWEPHGQLVLSPSDIYT